MSDGERSPGRPQAVESEGLEARNTLIRTAAGLFAEHGFDGTSLRQVAEGAGVTPAMVAYYFRDKSGLMEAVVRAGLEHLLSVVRGAVDTHEPGRFTEVLVRSYVSAVVREPWIPQLLIREVISKETPLRTLFMEEFARRAIELVPPRLAEEIRRGSLRADLDPRFAILSLVGMCLFPVIAQPVLGPLLGYELNEAFAAAYGAHVLTLFLEGAGGVKP
ncbi:MAG: TetR/AcrR family transcriptional regulator [Pseudomonadales bacterium]